MHAELILGLLVVIPVLNVLARLVRVPYPIVFVLGGLLLALLPGVPTVQLEPDLVLAIALPPLLYGTAYFADPAALRTDLRPLALLAVGLVLATAAGVAVVAHALVDGLPWAAAVALGAIVAPTDPIAASATLRRLGAPRRLLTVLEGEGLFNDAGALALYRVAVVGGTFSVAEAGLRLVLGAIGGVLIGLAAGWLVAAVRRRIDDAPTEITVSLATPFLAYLPADLLGASGVIAAVTVGIYLGRRDFAITSPATRLQASGFWDVLGFVLNAALFVLVGLQLGPILDRLSGSVVGPAAAVVGVVVGTRLLWEFTTPYLIRALDRRPQQRARRSSAGFRLVVAWSGMRGAVSLAAALALPADFPQRDLIVAVVFAVILVTLVGQGLTLGPLLTRLRLGGAEDDRAELHARLAATDAALDRLHELAAEDWTRDDTMQRMTGLYDFRRRRLLARKTEVDEDGVEERSRQYQRVVHEVLDAQRRRLVELRDAGEVPADVVQRIGHELDLEDTRLDSPPG
jgi:monovalent cation/hydrogen antiporter